MPAPPGSDFRAMPARGGGYAALKWVTSFPGNPERGLPTVSGIVLLSDAADGRLLAQLDAGAVRLRTGAAAVLAAGRSRRARASRRRRLRRQRARGGANVPGPRPRCPPLGRRRGLAAAVAEELGAARPARGKRRSAQTSSPPSRRDARSFSRGESRAGQHVSLMGADGPGKAEIAVEELARARVVVDEWEQASHNGDISRAVEAATLGPEDVTELGRILLGEAGGRAQADEITVFDSTGLAVQDLAVAALVYAAVPRRRGADAFAGVVEIALA